MPNIDYFVFRGTGRPEMKKMIKEGEIPRHPLLIFGHVGFRFDGDDRIIGFHPSIDVFDGDKSPHDAIQALIGPKPVEGSLYDNTGIFLKAAELAREGKRTEVWMISYEKDDEEFDQMKAQVFDWLAEGKSFQYRIQPGDVNGKLPGVDNCATFARHLGLPMLHSKGTIREIVKRLKKDPNGRHWNP